MIKLFKNFICLFTLIVFAVLFTSCTTVVNGDKSDDVGNLPWNKPAGWESSSPFTIPY